jgi:murein DD-endopeptidase MepM/ murein hydrolase activator NlpD
MMSPDPTCARRTLPLLLVALLAACGGPPPPPQQQTPLAVPLPPPLPDTSGWGVHTLSSTRAPGGDLWVGTVGEGLFVLRRGAREWQRLTPAGDQPWLTVTAVATQADAVVWYGSARSGFGMSSDSGGTWRHWNAAELGREWLRVAPHAIRTRADTVYIGTTDGVRITWDGGANWRCVQAEGATPAPEAPRADGCTERIAGLPSKYVLSLALTQRGTIYVSHLRGISFSRDAGRTWQAATLPAGARVRSIAATDSVVWAAGEMGILVDSTARGTFSEANIRPQGWPGLPGAPRFVTLPPGGSTGGPTIATSFGLASPDAAGQYRVYYLAAGEAYRPAADIWGVTWWGPPLWPVSTASTGLARVIAGESPFRTTPRTTVTVRPEAPRRSWLARPIDGGEGNPHIDGMPRFGATLGGMLPVQHGVWFGNPSGTPVRAVAAGEVVFAGAAADGSRTVAIRHAGDGGDGAVFTTYHHNATIDVAVGQQVAAGAVIARVGSTGAAGTERLELRVHRAAPAVTDAIVNPPAGVAANAFNPQLWIQPLPGTGVIAGRVLSADGQPVIGARVYGIVVPYPTEAPFSFAETYGQAARPDPLYNENFAVGDVPAGEYMLGVDIGEVRVWRRVIVAAGQVTFVDFRP